MLPFEVMGQFSQEFFPKERVIMPTNDGYQAGIVVNKFMTHGGEVNFDPNLFLNKTTPLNMNASSQKLSSGTVAAAMGTANDAEFGKQTNGGAGVYKYAVTFNNSHGESVPSNIVDVTIANEDVAKGVALTIQTLFLQHSL